MSITTVLFDLDGTLINTNELIIASFTHTLDRYYPGKYTRDDFIGFIGEPLEESFEKVDPKRVDELVRVYHKHNLDYHDDLVQEYEGVFETVKTLHERGIKLGVVTSKMRLTVDMGLKLSRLDSFFDTVVSLDDVEKAKPNPEPINRALSLLNDSPENAIMVGDSVFDIEAGKNAGTATAGVAWTIKGEDQLRAAGADVVLEEMADLLDVLGLKVK